MRVLISFMSVSLMAYRWIHHSLCLRSLLAWCPLSVLGDYSIVVQTGGGVLRPGDVLNYVVSANPVPSWTLGLVLIGTVADADGGAICWPWTTTMSATTKQGSIRVPSDVPSQ